MIPAILVSDIIPEFPLDIIPLDTIPFPYSHINMSILNLNKFFCKTSA